MKKKVFSLIAVAVLTLSLCLGLAACGSSVAGTYKLEMSGEDMKGKTSTDAFIDSMIDMAVCTGQTDTLVLNSDKTYELTKEIFFDSENPAAGGMEMSVKYVFSGTYTAKDNAVTLSAATSATAKEVWGAAEAYLGGKDTDSSDEPELLNFFATQYWKEGENADQTVTINTENSTFNY